jgi:outer membrane protein assembly factor BamB
MSSGGQILRFLAAALCAAAALPAAALAGGVTYQLTPAHDGHIEGDSLAPPLTRAWSADLGGGFSYAAIAHGHVYVEAHPAGRAILSAFDETSGHLDWSYDIGDTGSGGPAYEDGRVFTVSKGGLARAFDAGSGALAWAKQLDQYSFSSAPTAIGGVVYMGGAGFGATLYALRESDGALLWSQPVNGGDDSSPAVGGGRVFVSYIGPQTYAFRASSGAPLWHFSGSQYGGGGANAVLHAGRLYVRDQFEGDILFDAASGHVVGGFDAAYPPAFSGGTGLYRTARGSMRAVNLASGAERWSFGADDEIVTPAIAVDGVAYFGGRGGNVYGIDVASGKVAWRDNLGAPVVGYYEGGGLNPGLSAGDGLLTVGTFDHLFVYKGPHGIGPSPGAHGGDAALRAAVAHFGPIVRADHRRLRHHHRSLARLRRDLAAYAAAVSASHPKSDKLKRARKRLLRALARERRAAAAGHSHRGLAAAQRAVVRAERLVS